MKAIKKGLLIILALSVLGCNNYFHDLMPPDGNRILSFSVEGQIGNAVIGDEAINAVISIEPDITSIIPNIKVSPKATLFPLTLDYLERTFPGIDVFEAAVELHKAEDLEAYLEDLIRKHPDFKVPVMDKPIDFSGPVNFIVLSGQGNIRQYKVIINIDSGLPRLISFGFYKYDNPELIHDAVTAINESGQTIKSEILYPAEINYLSYQLIPVYEILGDRIEVDNEEVKSGIDTVKFTQSIGTKTKTITVWRDGISSEFILTAVFREDPDSVRSITDFRFNKIDNAGISINAVASIINNDALGTINAQVFYSGAKPDVLIPKFISPGNVTVNGIQQISGSNANNFSSSVEYRVVSRNNKFVRTYTVNVDFVDINSASPVINNFKFLSILNPEITDDSQAVISDASGQIMAAVKYRGMSAPETLTAEFSATGIVTVNSAVQTSGFSAQNFSRQVKYTVTNPENSLLTRDYWVQVNFIRDTSSDAAITSFSFHPDENTGLNEALTARIDNNAGKITIYAPIGSGVSTRTMYPRFTSAGQVSVNSVPQSSGTSGQNFNTPLIYKVVSANGINSREYLVIVRELRSTIYVNLNATGEGDGSSWSDAFRHLEDACYAAAEFGEDVPKEIWIAKGTYKPSSTGNSSEYFLLTPNTSYLGGFSGWETSKSERNTAVNNVVISGDLGGGTYSRQLFGNFNGSMANEINGDLIFENLEFTRARANGSDSRNAGAAINAAQKSGNDLRITNCTFNDLQSTGSGGAVYNKGSGNIEIKNVTISSIAAGGAIYNEGNSFTIKDSEIKNVTGTYSIYSSSGIEAVNLKLQNITGQGLYILSGALSLSNVNINNTSGRSVYFYSTANKAIIENSVFNDCGDVYLAGSSSATVTDTKVTNVKSGIAYGLYTTSSGNIYIGNVNVENVPGGIGIIVSTSGAVNIAWSNIKNTSNTGLHISNSSGTEISNVRIETTGGSGAIYNTGNNLKVINSYINTATGSYGVYSSKGITINGLELYNITNDGIYIRDGTMNISGVNASTIGTRSVYFYATGYEAVIINSNFNYCGSVYLSSASVILVRNTNITNIHSYIATGLYTYSPNGNITIDGVRLNAGISSNTTAAVLINNTNVSKRGIDLSGQGSNALINETIIFDITSGNAINAVNVASLTIARSDIVNVENNTALHCSGSNELTLSITNSRFDNCKLRAIYLQGSKSNFSITGTDFINCTGNNYNGEAFLINNGNGTFKDCTFVHNGALYNHSVDSSDSSHFLFRLTGTIIFDNCSFTNLRSTSAKTDAYIFGNFNEKEGANGTFIPGSLDLTLRNCNFTFRSGVKMGLMCFHNDNVHSPATVINLLLDGVSIVNNGSTIPLIVLHNYHGEKGTFRFKPNNRYNGTLLDTAAKISGLGNSVIRLLNGTTVTLVP